MSSKKMPFSWARLFKDPERVRVVKCDDGRTIANDRYTLWHLDPIAEHHGVEVPTSGLYKAMSREFRPIREDQTGAAQLPWGAFFDEKTAGLDLDDRVALSEWRSDHSWPVIRFRDASVRSIDAGYIDRLPRCANLPAWVACPGWDNGDNYIVLFDVVNSRAIGVVQLMGSTTHPDGITMPPHLAEAFAWGIEGISHELILARYGERRLPTT